MLDVSVIIANYNNFDLLLKCLATLYENTKQLEFEVILVDDNSVEGDINEVVKEFDKLILIKNPTNLGYSKTNNIGLKLAQGKYILLLNNDILFKENSIKTIFDYAEQQEESIFIGCKLLNPDNSWQASTAKFPSALNLFTSNFFLYKLFPSLSMFNKYYLQKKNIKVPVVVDYVLGAFLFGQREVFLKLQGFDERFFFYAEDIDICYRLRLLGGKTIFNPSTSVVHIGGASVKNNQWFKFKNKAVSELQFFQKHKKGLEFSVGLISHYLGNLIRIPLTFFIGVLKFDKELIKRSFFHVKLIFVYPKNLFK